MGKVPRKYFLICKIIADISFGLKLIKKIVAETHKSIVSFC